MEVLSEERADISAYSDYLAADLIYEYLEEVFGEKLARTFLLTIGLTLVDMSMPLRAKSVKILRTKNPELKKLWVFSALFRENSLSKNNPQTLMESKMIIT